MVSSRILPVDRRETVEKKKGFHSSFPLAEKHSTRQDTKVVRTRHGPLAHRGHPPTHPDERRCPIPDQDCRDGYYDECPLHAIAYQPISEKMLRTHSWLATALQADQSPTGYGPPTGCGRKVKWKRFCSCHISKRKSGRHHNQEKDRLKAGSGSWMARYRSRRSPSWLATICRRRR